MCNCRIVASVVWWMEEHNGQFFTALAELSEMCGQAEIIAYCSACLIALVGKLHQTIN